MAINLTLTVEETVVNLSVNAGGAEGDSAYQVWLNEGNTGTAQDFLDSLVGATGMQGIQGETGATGIQGPQGIQGVPGSDGVDGQGVPAGGTTGQVPVKLSDADYNIGWTTVGGAVSNDDLDTFYLFGAGQSNLTGAHSDDFSSTLIEGENPQNKIKIWNRYNTAWEVWDLNSVPTQYGDALSTNPATQLSGVPGRNCPMFHLAQEIVYRTGKEVRVLMSEKGGANIDLWLTSANGGSSQIWDIFLQDVANSGVPRIDGAVWMHGENHENDTKNDNYAPRAIGSLDYSDDVVAYWEQVIAATNSNGGSLMNSKTPIAVGQIRDFFQTSLVRLGGPEGVNGLFNRWLDKKESTLDTLPANLITSPHRNLGSDDNISPDGSNHYGRRELVEMGRKYWYSSIFVPGNPMYQPNPIISEDKTFVIGTDGYYTDRINGKFNNWDNFWTYYQNCIVVDGAQVTLLIQAGNHSFNMVLNDHPNLSNDFFTIKGAPRNTLPTLTGVEIDDIAALDAYLPTRISGTLTLYRDVAVENIFFKGSGTGTGITTRNRSTKIQHVAAAQFQNGIRSFNSFFDPGNYVYVVHNSIYGIGAFYGSSNLYGPFTSLYNGRFDYYATSLHQMNSGAKSGATFNITRGSGVDAFGAAIY